MILNIFFFRGVVVFLFILNLMACNSSYSKEASVFQRNTAYNKGENKPQFKSQKVDSDLTIALSPDVSDFAINDGIPGSGKLECGSDQTSKGWQIGQWNNDPEHSLCNKSSAVPKEKACKGADWERSSKTLNTCYWKNEKKFLMTVNTAAMKNQGCCVYCLAGARQHPGGYAIKLGWASKHDPKVANSDLLNVNNLSSLIVSTGFASTYYNAQPCSASVQRAPANAPKAPPGGVAHAHANLFFADIDTATKKVKRTIVFGATLWDSRANWSVKKKFYTNCNFATGAKRWTVITPPINYYRTPTGGPITVPQPDNKTTDKIEYYTWDVLPVLLSELKRCTNDISGLRFTGAYFGNELFNGVTLTNIFVDPTIKLVGKK